jgi:hypothetical protein
VIQSAVGPGAPNEMPPVPVNLTAVIGLKAGTARGRHALKLSIEAPSGLTVGEEATLPVLFEGEDRGANLILGMGLQLSEEGLYWFNVLFGDDERLLTRIPLRIVYQPQRIGTGGPPGPAS